LANHIPPCILNNFT